ncbi:MAG: putative zinc-binding metallopeptidase [Thermoanaerobaculia bacterium]
MQSPPAPPAPPSARAPELIPATAVGNTIAEGREGREGKAASPLRARKARRPLRIPASEWSSWEDEQLLGLRFSELELPIAGSELEPRLADLQAELDHRGLAFRPHFWLSNEWFSPDGVPGIAIPFYLAHPRLARLELHQMFEIEGGTHEWCMKILRHEAGHAIENAFKLRSRRRRHELFGSTRVPYPDFYAPRPYSKSFVIHLDAWYAQSHPDEDFAETFAVWLHPKSRWQERYQGWPALRKLEYMEELMGSLAGRTPLVSSNVEVDPLATLATTLRQHYAQKRAHYGVNRPEFYDRDLRRLFSDAPAHSHQPTAAAFIARYRREIRLLVARWTNEYQYTIDQVLADMITRCRELGLRLATPPEQAKREFAVLLTVQTMNYLHSGRHRVAL